MRESTWGFGQWLLLILAAVVVGAYFGVLGPVQEALEEKVDVIEKKIEQRLDKRQAALRLKLEKLGNQPKVQEKFVDSETAWAEAAVVLAFFIFLTPIAIAMAIVLLIFLCAAIAHMLPLPEAIPHKAAVAALLIIFALVTFVVRDRWVPYAQYYAGWVAKAYLVATSG